MSRNIGCLALVGLLVSVCSVTGQGQKKDKEEEKSLPKELMGKWVVVEGPQEGAAFEFFPDGKMIAKVNLNGKEGIIHATVRVENKKLLSTTKNPQTGKEDSRALRIRILTAKEFVLEDDQGKLWKMWRAESAKKP